ncbi:MAG: hypothetical protein AAF721_10345 [Myxococcota bacterium]
MGCRSFVMLVVAFAGAGCASHDATSGESDMHAEASRHSPIAPEFATAYKWLDALRRGDESILRRGARVPDERLGFVAEGFADHSGPCAATSLSAGQFAEQLHCVMRGHSDAAVPIEWTLRALESPEEDADAWSRDEPGPTDHALLAPKSVRVIWTARLEGSGGCRYRVGMTPDFVVNSVERACWLE